MRARVVAVCAAVVLVAGLAAVASYRWPLGAPTRRAAVDRFLSALQHRDLGRLRTVAPTSGSRRNEWTHRYGGIPASAVDVTLYPKAFSDQRISNAGLVFHLPGGQTAEEELGQYHDLRGWFAYVYPPDGPCPPAAVCG